MNKSFLWVNLAAVGLVASWVGCGSSSGTAGTKGTGGTSNTTSSSTASTSSGHGGHTSTSSTSTSSSTTSTSTSSSSSTTSTSTSSSGAMNPFECTVPAPSPSGGSCVTVIVPDAGAADAGAGIACNPVTNAGCQAGEECDYDIDSMGNTIGFGCYPPPNPTMVCQKCDLNNNITCAGGLTCFAYDMAGDSVCAKYCCTDADCGTGKCTTKDSTGSFFGPVAPNLGVCTLM